MKAEQDWATKFRTHSGNANVSACFLYGAEFFPDRGVDSTRCRQQCYFKAGSKCVHSSADEGRTIHVVMGYHRCAASQARGERDLEL